MADRLPGHAGRRHRRPAQRHTHAGPHVGCWCRRQITLLLSAHERCAGACRNGTGFPAPADLPPTPAAAPELSLDKADHTACWPTFRRRWEFRGALMSIRTRLPASPSAASHNTPPASSHEPLASTARRHPGRPLALLMVLSLAACGGSGSDDAGQSAQLTQKAETPVLSSSPSSTTSGTENTTPNASAAGNTTPASDASTASTPSTSTSTTEASAATTPAATPAATADAVLAAVPSELVDDKEIRSDVVMAALFGHATEA